MTSTTSTQHPEIASRPKVVSETPKAAAHRRRITKTLAKKSFATIATTSEAGRPHSTGVVYEWVNNSIWIHTMRPSRKARNVASSGYAAVTVPFRRLPAGPPFTIHFQATAEVVSMDDPEVNALLAAGQLKKISGHGALEEAEGCFLRLRPTGTIHSYGPSASVIGIIRDPLNEGAGQVTAASIRSQS